MNILDNTLQGIFNFLLISNNKLNSIVEENNILGKYDNFNIVTKDENFVTMFEIEGISYSSKDEAQIRDFLMSRNNFFKSIDSMFYVSIFQKRMKKKINFVNKIENKYAREIVDIWNFNMVNNIFDTKYYIVISSRNKNIKNLLEQKKDKILNGKIDNSSSYLNDKIHDISKNLLKLLSKYNIRRLSADETLSFYASYCNMKETNVKVKKGLLHDSYINTNISFKKNYIIHEDIEKRYSRFISVKVYDTDKIDSNLMKDFLELPNELMICENIVNITKEKSISYLESKIRKSSELVLDELIFLLEEIKTDRETLVEYSLSILITENTYEKLNDLTKTVENIFTKYELITVAENKNLQTLYFSFFPSRENLNARKRNQTSTALSVLNCFEKDIKGHNKNSFGDSYVTLFKTLNETPYKFNFHNSTKAKAKGHTLLVATSEGGKTTLMSLLLTCLHKYDLNILAYDKLYGMHNMCEYLDGNYEEVNEEFALNPFSLEDDEENKIFLLNFLKQIGEIKNDDFQFEEAIKDTINELYEHKDSETVITYSHFVNALQRVEGLELRFTPYLNGIFDNESCAISFEKQLTVLGMDSILKDSKLASLVNMYVSHKLKRYAQTQNKDFLVFTDEAKDYITNENIMRQKIEAQVEVRKIGGVLVDAIQNIDFLDGVKNRDTYFDSFSQYIIFPTSKKSTLENLKVTLNLNDNDIDFLKNSDPNKYQVLCKDTKTQDSVFLDISLSSLGKHLKIFSGDSEKVLELKKLKKNNPNNWREEYLND